VARLLRSYLTVLAVLTALSALAQLFFPEQVGATSPWGVAPGWQREIGLWNVAMYVMIVRTIRHGDKAAQRTIAIGLVMLQFLIATNHVAAIRHANAELNAVMAVVNYLCVALGLAALWGDRR